eukprot:3936791-Rhodomonas_salina.2
MMFVAVPTVIVPAVPRQVIPVGKEMRRYRHHAFIVVRLENVGIVTAFVHPRSNVLSQVIQGLCHAPSPGRR